MPQMAPSSARGAQLLLPSSKPAQAAPSFTPKDQPSTSPSPGLTPSRPQATEDEALRAAVAEARQGGGSSANLFLFLIYSAGQRACDAPLPEPPASVMPTLCLEPAALAGDRV